MKCDSVPQNQKTIMKKGLLLILLIGFMAPVFAQLNQEETFGKNRVQYHKDFKYWWKYETDNFITYWYTPARKVAESAILLAEQDYQEIQGLLEHHINDKIQIIVFKDLTDFKQSNLGSEEIFEIEAGQTKVEGNRIFVYSTGDHSQLRHQIREGIASVHIKQMLQGSTIQELVQNAFLSALPPWYVPGLISYVGSPYDYDFENDLRAYFAQYNYDDFEKFGLEFPTLAGHAMWNYIHSKYGPTNLSNLLYITRINRKMDNGFIYVLGESFDDVSAECYTYYRSAFNEQETFFSDPIAEEIKIKKKKVSKRSKGVYDIRVSDMELSDDGKTLMYVTNELGKYRVWLYDVESKKQKQLLKGSFRNPFQEADYSYPNVEWGMESNEIYAVQEKNDRLYLKYWDLNSGDYMEQEFPPAIERIYSMDVFSRDTLLFSATSDGYTDLYFYTPKTRQTFRLTTDYFDDIDAKTVQFKGQRYIAFTSNRLSLPVEKMELDTVLPEDHFDIYLMSPFSGFTQRLTNSTWASEKELAVVGSEIHYISDENGIQNRWKIDIAADNIEPVMLSQYQTGINDFAKSGNIVVENVRSPKNASLRIVSTDDTPVSNVHYTSLAELRRKQFEKKPLILDEEILLPETQIEDSEYFFQSRFEEEIPLPDDFGADEKNDNESLLIVPDFSNVSERNENQTPPKTFNSARVLAYRMTFGMTDFDVDLLSNELLFSGLNSYTGMNQGFDFPETGILLKTELRDLFENYIISAGARVPLTFNGTEFYLSVEDRKYQLDRKFSLYRSSKKEREDMRFVDNPDTRNITHIGIYQLTYPFSIFSSLRLLTTLRFDRTVILPDQPSELNADDLNQQRIGLRLEYVFDNTYSKMPNIMHGTRAKIFIEGTNRFQVQFDPGEYDLSKAFMTTIGFDVRHYIRLDRHSIFATRLAGATSFGSERILYTLGGVKNWISPNYNQSTPRPQSNDFAFQAAVNDMRGFDQNIRNGSSYLLANAELRIPFFNYFSRREIKSKFLRNFQIVGFVDAGTAWHGRSPTSPGNLLNQETLTNRVSEVQVQFFRDPLIVGYGAGARINLFGYFLRLDYAWGFETRQQTDPIFYLSLGHDF